MGFCLLHLCGVCVDVYTIKATSRVYLHTAHELFHYLLNTKSFLQFDTKPFLSSVSILVHLPLKNV